MWKGKPEFQKVQEQNWASQSIDEAVWADE
jgi:hypothetical protein